MVVIVPVRVTEEPIADIDMEVGVALGLGEELGESVVEVGSAVAAGDAISGAAGLELDDAEEMAC